VNAMEDPYESAQPGVWWRRGGLAQVRGGGMSVRSGNNVGIVNQSNKIVVMVMNVTHQL